ncbi:alanine--tRNA ligase [bacterium]|nr:alanine--tRNA ligase [bacterium]
MAKQAKASRARNGARNEAGRSVSDIRSAFLGYFEAADHVVRPSSPLVPQGDATLLFTNAGMVPFKNAFLGLETLSSPRAATSQKCVRAGGKHNDLDNVGYTARHHTFFEMLGNFSFGDYFKDRAIELAWGLITREFALPVDRLLVTVYSEDEEAAGLWRRIAGLPDSKIIRIPTSDNFWSMGDTGPCGPCSEIFFDHGADVPGGPPGSPDADGDRFVEIWNLVFMQFDQSADGARKPLPRPSIDTGMGLERIAAVMQGVHNNYDIDLFAALIRAAEDVYGRRAEGDALASFRVIADHLRATAFLIADGVTPANDGRGYVLRRIMRRAMRHGHLLGAQEPVMHRLVAALSAEMGAAYPELVRAQPAIISALEQEEGRFQRTLGRGLALLEEAARDLPEGARLPGETAFRLYDTYGFPLDLTEDVLRARGLAVDTAGFEAAMTSQRERARESWQGSGETGSGEVWFALRSDVGATDFLGYERTSAKAPLKAIIVEGGRRDSLRPGERAELVFSQTPFYAESGGQVGDAGEIRFPGGVFTVEDVQKRAGDVFAHIGVLTSGPEVALGAAADLVVDAVRRNRIRANHSATHLLHASLRAHLGAHVTQRGSLVDPDKLRFDFSHPSPVSPAELDAIEAEVNQVIRQNAAADTRDMTPDAAIAAGALALFGEKYGDRVRVLALGEDVTGTPRPYSVELCGGTHVGRTGDIALFVITSESGVSSGVRRIEAVTGAAALAFLKARAAVARDVADILKSPIADAPARVTAIADARRKLENELSDALRKLAMGGGGPAQDAAETVSGIAFVGRVAEGVPARDLRTLIDAAKQKLGSGVAAFVAVNDGKAAVAVGVTDDLTGRFSAVDLVKIGAAAVGGAGGGGRPDLAQAGGPHGDKANEAIAAVRAAITAG